MGPVLVGYHFGLRRYLTDNMDAVINFARFDGEMCMECFTERRWGSQKAYDPYMHAHLVRELLSYLNNWFGKSIRSCMHSGTVGMVADPSHCTISLNDRIKDPRDLVQEAVHGYAHLLFDQECVVSPVTGGTHDASWLQAMWWIIGVLRRAAYRELPPTIGCLATGGLLEELHARPSLCYHALATQPQVCNRSLVTRTLV